MIAIVSRYAQIAADVFVIFVLFCGLGLLVSPCLATYGLDLSPGFF